MEQRKSCSSRKYGGDMEHELSKYRVGYKGAIMTGPVAKYQVLVVLPSNDTQQLDFECNDFMSDDGCLARFPLNNDESIVYVNLRNIIQITETIL